MVCNQSLGTQITMLQCTIAGGRTKGANWKSFIFVHQYGGNYLSHYDNGRCPRHARFQVCLRGGRARPSCESFPPNYTKTLRKGDHKAPRSWWKNRELGNLNGKRSRRAGAQRREDPKPSRARNPVRTPGNGL